MFKPEVGPRVESDAGEPASPNALECDPQMDIARFQLGLLNLQLQQVAPPAAPARTLAMPNPPSASKCAAKIPNPVMHLRGTRYLAAQHQVSPPNPSNAPSSPAPNSNRKPRKSNPNPRSRMKNGFLPPLSQGNQSNDRKKSCSIPAKRKSRSRRLCIADVERVRLLHPQRRWRRRSRKVAGIVSL